MKNKILVVDDERDYCEALQDLLNGNGCHVVSVHSGKEALPAYRQHQPDVVLLDVLMPGKDGWETLLELIAFDPEARVIMVTAFHEEKLALQALADGAFDYITKPLNPNYLEMALKMACGGVDNPECFSVDALSLNKGTASMRSSKCRLNPFGSSLHLSRGEVRRTADAK